MTSNEIREAASHYIKHKARLALARHSDTPDNLFDAYGTTVTKRWFEAIAAVDITAPEVFDQLSVLVNEVYLETVREFQEKEKDMNPTIFLRGMADFLGTFNVSEMLPRGQA